MRREHGVIRGEHPGELQGGLDAFASTSLPPLHGGRLSDIRSLVSILSLHFVLLSLISPAHAPPFHSLSVQITQASSKRTR